jgi:hypothetical protein
MRLNRIASMSGFRPPRAATRRRGTIGWVRLNLPALCCPKESSFARGGPTDSLHAHKDLEHQ